MSIQRGRKTKQFVPVLNVCTNNYQEDFFDKCFDVTLTEENSLFLEGHSAHVLLRALGPGSEVYAP